jgi:hypothetical protein
MHRGGRKLRRPMQLIDNVEFPSKRWLHTESDSHNNSRHTSRTGAPSLNIVSPSLCVWCSPRRMGLVDFQAHILEGIFKGARSFGNSHGRVACIDVDLTF